MVEAQENNASGSSFNPQRCFSNPASICCCHHSCSTPKKKIISFSFDLSDNHGAEYCGSILLAEDRASPEVRCSSKKEFSTQQKRSLQLIPQQFSKVVCFIYKSQRSNICTIINKQPIFFASRVRFLFPNQSSDSVYMVKKEREKLHLEFQRGVSQLNSANGN